MNGDLARDSSTRAGLTRRRGPHRHRRVAAFIFVVMFVLASAAAIRIWSLYLVATAAKTEIELAIATVRGGGTSLTGAQAASITEDLAQADASLAQIQSALNADPIVRILRVAPVLDRQAAAAGTLVQAGRLLTSRSGEVGALLSSYVQVRDGNQGLQRIAALARLAAAARPQTDDLLAAFDASDRMISGLSPVGLLGPIASARADLAAQFADARPIAAGRRSWTRSSRRSWASAGSDATSSSPSTTPSCARSAV